MANRTVFCGLKSGITRLVLMASLGAGLPPAVHAQISAAPAANLERNPSAKPNLIDLTAYYNARLTEAWLGRPDNDLASLPAGLQSFGGEDYDVRGLIQLAGKNEATKRFPKSVKGIEVNQKCARLHFLDAVAFGNGVAEGDWVGSYVVHFASNQMQFEIPLYYAHNIRDWHALTSEKPGANELRVVWTGANKYSTQLHRSLRLFSTTWENATPDVEIKNIDFISAVGTAAPFLIAITADSYQDADALVPPVARAELPPAKSAASPGDAAPNSPMLAKTTPPAGSQQILWIALGFLAGGLVLFAALRWRTRRLRLPDAPAALLEAGPPTEGIVVAPPQNHRTIIHITMDTATQTQSQTQAQARPQPLLPRPEALPEDVRAGVIAQLTRWFKGKMVQRLVSDRAQLLDTQESAARKMLAVDERLSKIERQIQQRNHEYEQRIDELEKELLTAREENRELIRAKIVIIKAEMEKERLKAEQYIKEQRKN